MRTYKDTGITFKQININEADTIYSILTKYHGRVDAIAKGIRRITSRKAGNIDIMTLSKFAFAKGKNLDIITEVELVDDYEDLKKNLKSTYIIFYLSELIDNFIKVGENQLETFNLLVNLLDILKNTKSIMPIISFELKLLSIMGFEPNLDICIKCNEKFKLSRRRYISIQQLGFICDNHGGSDELEISDKELKVFRFLKGCELKKTIMLKDTRKISKVLKTVTQSWIYNVLDKELKSANKVFYND